MKTQREINLPNGEKVLETVFTTFPSWAVPYAYYGQDAAGDLTEEEMQLVDDFLSEYGDIVCSSDDQEFSWNPFFGPACNVLPATFWKYL